VLNCNPPSKCTYKQPIVPEMAMVYQRSCAGNRHFCDLLARIEDHIIIILIILCCVWHFPVKNYLSIVLIWSSILANKSQKCRFPALDGDITLIFSPE